VLSRIVMQMEDAILDLSLFAYSSIVLFCLIHMYVRWCFYVPRLACIKGVRICYAGIIVMVLSHACMYLIGSCATCSLILVYVDWREYFHLFLGCVRMVAWIAVLPLIFFSVARGLLRVAYASIVLDDGNKVGWWVTFPHWSYRKISSELEEFLVYYFILCSCCISWLLEHLRGGLPLMYI